MKEGSYSRRKGYAETYYWHLPVMASSVRREVNPDGHKAAPEAGAFSRKTSGYPGRARLVSGSDGEASGRGGYDSAGANIGVRDRKARAVANHPVTLRAGRGRVFRRDC